MPHPWDDQPSPAQTTVDWHREAAARDQAYLAQGPADDTETHDSPWRNQPPVHGRPVAGHRTS